MSNFIAEINMFTTSIHLLSSVQGCKGAGNYLSCYKARGVVHLGQVENKKKNPVVTAFLELIKDIFYTYIAGGCISCQ